VVCPAVCSGNIGLGGARVTRVGWVYSMPGPLVSEVRIRIVKSAVFEGGMGGARCKDEKGDESKMNERVWLQHKR
jgi:hypothetical protein